MNTKIVYALVSNESDIYLEQTLLSAYSARIHMPDVEIILIIDDLTEITIKGNRCKIMDYITSKIVIKIEGKYTNQQRSRILKTNMRKYVIGDFLFIDSDTIITSSLSEIDSFTYNIGAVRNLHMSGSAPIEYIMSRSDKNVIKKMEWPIENELVYFNSGVLYVKDNYLTRKFYDTWSEYWHKSKTKGVNVDQPALAMANILNDHIIQELPDAWNCQIYYGLRYLNQSKIIHYFNQNVYLVGEPLFEFMKKEFYLGIRQDGIITNKVDNIVKKPYNYFNENLCIIHGQNLNLWHSDTLSFIRYIYFKHNSFFRHLNFLSKIIINVKLNLDFLFRYK
jgi:hypothetical protein